MPRFCRDALMPMAFGEGIPEIVAFSHGRMDITDGNIILFQTDRVLITTRPRVNGKITLSEKRLCFF